MSEQHPIESLMQSVLENLKKMVDANTVIGEPIILPNGVSIIPVTRLSCGFGCGGSEFVAKANTEKMPFGGGTGGGISLQPLGFICVTAAGDNVEFLPVEESGGSDLDGLIHGISSLCQNIKWPKKKGKTEDITAEVMDGATTTVTE